MKLSMWMLANRLSSLDLVLNIADDAKPILKSARRVYATNCVHVYQEGYDVICNGEGDTIRIKDMPVTEAFELVQYVFDFYEDWYSEVLELIKSGNYPEAVNSCWSVFHNPIMLFDGNCKLLGITEQYTADEMDDEWRYLLTYGYSSIRAISYIKFQHANRDFAKSGMQRFDFKGDLCYPGITYSLYFNEILCGRINVLEKDRPLNSGDFQLLELLADILKVYLAEQSKTSSQGTNMDFFHLLLAGVHVDDEQLELLLSYPRWEKEDLYQIYVAQVASPDLGKDQMNLFSHTIEQQMQQCVIIRKFPDIIILCNLSRYQGMPPLDILTRLADGAKIHLSCSLPGVGIINIHYLMNQALASLGYGRLQFPEKKFHEFYQYAMDYIIEAKNLSDCIHACHPDVLALWKHRRNSSDYKFDTLKAYLNNERSLVNTAQALYVHRNTLVYRVRRLTEFLHYNLDDVYTRDYMKLSIRTLELYEQKLKSGETN